jgi:hypothetical protein
LLQKFALIERADADGDANGASVCRCHVPS